MAQSSAINAFRIRAKKLGFKEISIRRVVLDESEVEAGQSVVKYLVEMVEPFSGQRVDFYVDESGFPGMLNPRKHKVAKE